MPPRRPIHPVFSSLRKQLKPFQYNHLDDQISWNTTNPDLTECFQKTVLIWVPCGFLWLATPFFISVLYKHKVKRIPWSGLNISKLILGAFTAVLILIDAIRKVNLYLNNYDIPSVDFISPLIHYSSLILATILMYIERRRGRPPSGVIFIFWLLMSVTGAVTFRTTINKAVDETTPVNQDLFSFVIYMIYYPLTVTELVLCCFSDNPPARKVLHKEEKELSPELHASFLSRILFAWFDRLIVTGYRKPLAYKDVWKVTDSLATKTVSLRIQKHWNPKFSKNGSVLFGHDYLANGVVQDKTSRKKISRKKPSFFISLCKTFGTEFLFMSLLELINITTSFVNPLALELIIQFVQSDEPMWRGYLYGAIIFFAAIFQSLIMTNLIHLAVSLSAKVRSAMIHEIYTKALRLSNSARRASTVGEIVNLMAVDSQALIELLPDLNTVWSAPLQISIALYMLWGQLGPSVLAGLAVIILLLPVNGFLIKKVRLLQKRQMEHKDQRVKLMNELLSGIKVLKMYAWERPFAAQIDKVRQKELHVLKIGAYISGVNLFLWRAAPFFMLLAAFGTYVMADSANILDATKAFVSLSLFNIVRLPLVNMPNVLVGLAKASVSLNRMQEFLLNDELDPHTVLHGSSKEINSTISIDDGTFSWSLEMEPALKNIHLNVPKGHLVAIVGSVGAGKSSLLSAILGEMEKLHGIVQTQGSIAYTSQQAWIQNATVRDNITFGSHYDAHKYNKIIHACDLGRDLEILPAGNETEVGEKGINLSGGQKQRISLARAVYNDADVYLLDDPLSSVDAHVGRHIFDEVIGRKGLLKKKTRLLVTHGITYLPQADVIIVLKNQTISEVGSYQELLDKKGAFAEFLITYLNEVDETEDDEVLEEIKGSLLTKLVAEPEGQLLHSTKGKTDLKEIVRQMSRSLSTQRSRDSDSKQQRKRRSVEETNKNLKTQDGKLVTTETAEIGKVNLRLYLYYLTSVGVWLGLGTFLLNVLAWTCSVGSNLWLEAWSSDPLPINGTQDTALRDLRLGGYAGLGFSFAFLILFGTMTLALNCVQASLILHDQMLKSVLHSPMAFFDTTPVGRILNRFSQDVNVVDNSLPFRARASLSTIMQVIGSLMVITLETPIFLAVMIPVSGLYYVFQKFYLLTSRQLKRMESITRSAIYSHFSETLTGGPTIRAYKKQFDFTQDSNRRVDDSQCYYYAGLVCTRWLKIRLDVVGSLIVLAAVLFALLNKDNLNSSSVGLSITYALSITSLLNWCVRMLTDLEKDFVAVERIKEYVETTNEASWDEGESKLPLNWPDHGYITFDQYKTRYREGLDMVLRGITCNISSQEKVGVVGRTGAGKSSLTLALFRIMEATYGAIYIDGINISKIGLHDLRSRLTIIPQDPVLFSGTLRDNLDPFNAYSDEQIWRALQHCHLHSFVKTLPETLHHEIVEGGENLSVGQRQLVCLGRALLRKTKVLILDEATAAVDLETDELIQATIRQEFEDCTIITIAHRLNTIMDNDRVMVLDDGIIKEFDKPSILLQDKSSHFYNMAKDAGLVTDQSTK